MLHDGVYDVGVLAINIQADAAGVSAVFVGQSLGQFFPICAAIRRFVDRAIRTTTIETEGRPSPLVRRGI